MKSQAIPSRRLRWRDANELLQSDHTDPNDVGLHRDTDGIINTKLAERHSKGFGLAMSVDPSDENH
jgi:hypothetical protein